MPRMVRSYGRHLTLAVVLRKALVQYSRPSFSLNAVVAMFVIFDLPFAVSFARDRSWPVAVGVVVLLAAILTRRFTRSQNDRTRLVWLGGLIALLLLLPEFVNISSQGPNPR